MLISSTFRDRNPTLFSVISSVREQIGPLKAYWVKQDLIKKGISYANFSSYMSGRTELPGSILGDVVEDIGWEWAITLPLHQRIVLADSLLQDYDTSLSARLHAMTLYFAAFREAHDINAHEQLCETLKCRFPRSKYPAEYAAILHENALMKDAARHNGTAEPEKQSSTISRWLAVRTQLDEAERQGYFNVDLHLAVVRDYALGLSELECEDFRLGHGSEILNRILNDLLECKKFLPERGELCCFHWFSVVEIALRLKNENLVRKSVAELELACSRVGNPDSPEATPLWLRYYLAQANVAKHSGDMLQHKQFLLHACNKLSRMRDHAWELQIRRYLDELET